MSSNDTSLANDVENNMETSLLARASTVKLVNPVGLVKRTSWILYTISLILGFAEGVTLAIGSMLFKMTMETKFLSGNFLVLSFMGVSQAMVFFCGLKARKTLNAEDQLKVVILMRVFYETFVIVGILAIIMFMTQGRAVSTLFMIILILHLVVFKLIHSRAKILEKHIRKFQVNTEYVRRVSSVSSLDASLIL